MNLTWGRNDMVLGEALSEIAHAATAHQKPRAHVISDKRKSGTDPKPLPHDSSAFINSAVFCNTDSYSV